MKSLAARILFALVILAPEAILFAQTPPEEPQEPPKLEEEMVVTARKREEAVEDVPISVAAPTESQLRDRGAETIEDVSVNVANFTVQNLGPGQSQVAMRGVSAGQIVRDQPGVKEQVGVYLDESVISLSLFTPDIDLFDLSRVEVLRGPQGTLFGSGSLSGTVRYITNQPQLNSDDRVGELTLSSISDGGMGASAKAAINVPFGDRAAMRVAAYYTRYGGFVDAIQPGLSVNEDVNDGDRIGARVAFRFDPNDNLTIIPRILFQQVELNGWNRADEFNILANPFTTTRPKVSFDEREQFTQMEEPYSDDFLLGDLNVSWDIGGFTLTSVTSYTDRDVLVIRDATALTASITGGTIGLSPAVYNIDAPLYDDTQAKALTQEVRVSGGVAGGMQWVAGIFYSDAERDYAQNLPVIGFEDTARNVDNVNIPTAGTKLALKDELYKSDLHYDFKQTALFGEVTWAATPRLDLTGGLRFYDFEENRVQIFDGIFADPIDSTGSTSADGFAPRVIASWKLSDATRFNAQVSKGFRLGGINDPLNLPLCTANDLATYGGHPTWDDETLWNYEVGVKSALRGGRGSFSAAAYYMDIENLQATVTAGSCSSRIILNVPDAHSRGVEAEFELAPSDNFDFAVSGAWNNAELGSTLTAPDAQGVQHIIAGIEEGNRLPTVPELQFAAAATWRFPMTGFVPYATAVYQHVGDRYTQVADQAAGFGTVNIAGFTGDIGGPFTQDTFTFNPKLPAYDIVNLRFGVLRNNWDAALFINNVTDETALLALDQERGTRARVGHLINQPRTIGISTRVTF